MQEPSEGATTTALRLSLPRGSSSPSRSYNLFWGRGAPLQRGMGGRDPSMVLHHSWCRAPLRVSHGSTTHSGAPSSGTTGLGEPVSSWMDLCEANGGGGGQGEVIFNTIFFFFLNFPDLCSTARRPLKAASPHTAPLSLSQGTQQHPGPGSHQGLGDQDPAPCPGLALGHCLQQSSGASRAG